MAFFQWRVLEEAEKRPWSLGRGNVRQNFVELYCEKDCPEEPIAAKIWMLLQIFDCSEEILVSLERAIKLLMDCPWLTQVTEQLHSLAAVVHRHHHEIEVKALLSRALLGCYNKTLPRQTVNEKQAAKLEHKLAQLEAKKPQYISARNMYVSGLASVAKDYQKRKRLH